MTALFPSAPVLPAAISRTRPACEWIVPAVRRRHRFAPCGQLEAGMPDCLQVQVRHTEDGTERCTAAMYGGRAYLIHYTFMLRAAC